MRKIFAWGVMCVAAMMFSGCATPLLWSVKKGNVRQTKEMLREGNYSWYVSSSEGSYRLIGRAVENKDLEMIKLLADFGADINDALDYIIEEHEWDMLSCILKAGATPTLNHLAATAEMIECRRSLSFRYISGLSRRNATRGHLELLKHYGAVPPVGMYTLVVPAAFVVTLNDGTVLKKGGYSLQDGAQVVSIEYDERLWLTGYGVRTAGTYFWTTSPVRILLNGNAGDVCVLDCFCSFGSENKERSLEFHIDTY